jgi:GWxTD domain-containing protein
LTQAFSQNKGFFTHDYCLFKNSDGKVILELYYSFEEDHLTYIDEPESGFTGAGLILLEIFDITTQNLIHAKNYKVPLVIYDTSRQYKTGRLVGQINLLLDSGQYKINIGATDFYNPLDTSKHEETFTLARFPENRLCCSSIQLSGNISKSTDVGSIFYKNTLEIEPNPLRLFGNNKPKVYYYSELYNLKPPYVTNQYSVVFTFTDLNDVVLKSNSKNYTIKSESKIEYGVFDVSDVPTGKYKVKMKIEDSTYNKLLEVEKILYVLNTGDSVINKQTDDADYLASEYINYSAEKVDEEFNISSYLMTETAKKNYTKLNILDQKRRFLFNFWKMLDPNPITSLNEFKKEYKERIEYANKNYQSEFREGWKSDRGRIYCVYGKPDELEKYPFESETRAYEIWHYYSIEGGVEFVFIDLSSDAGDFTLVHSTKVGEINDPNWKRRLRAGNF